MSTRNEYDPATLAVIQNGLSHIVDEMDLAIERAAFNPVMSESRDRASGIYKLGTGEIIAQGETGLPVFVGVMQFAVKGAIDAYPDIRPDDIICLNDPYIGGTHLMDAKLVKPFFHQGKMFAWLASTGHWADVGGAVPGGFSAKATEVIQEGLRIPPVKLYSEGRLNEDMLKLMLANMRIPDERWGDLQAQLAALAVGEERLSAFLEKYGGDLVADYVDELFRRSETQMRAAIAGIPDGQYRFETQLDSDGLVWKPIKLALDLTIDGDAARFDFSRSDPPVKGPLNAGFSATAAAVYLSMKHIFPDIPINGGCWRPLDVYAPPTTFLNARYPKAVSGSSAEVTLRVCDAVFGALAQAIPDQVPAASFGTVANLSIGGYDPKRDKHYILFRFSGGGYGGHPQSDGLTNGCGAISMARISSLEIQEQLYPVMFEHFRMHSDSGGAGMRRGGYGADYRMRIERGEATASCLGDRGLVGPYGLHGGRDGGKAVVEFGLNGKRFVPEHLTKDERIEMHRGDTVRCASPGGGGWGDPLDRDAKLVLRDVIRELISSDDAREIYGVVTRPDGLSHTLDEEATQALRATMCA